MPTILDATVVASVYQTSASARPQKLSNGWFVELVKDTSVTYRYFLYVSKNSHMTNATRLCSIDSSSFAMYGGSIEHDGNFVYVSYGMASGGIKFHVINALTQTDVNIYSNAITIDNNTTADFSLCQSSLITEPTLKEIHIGYNKKLSGQNSQNIFYAKGTINADGSVAWGAVVQISTLNTTGSDCTSPSIVVKSNGFPTILHAYVSSGLGSVIYSNSHNGTSFSTVSSGRGVEVYNANGNYTQSSPSAIFVPQSVNGLANGRIWVAWHGTDATDTTQANIRVSYSEDGGVTWSAMQKLTSGNSFAQEMPSITVNKSNKVFILFRGVTVVNSTSNYLVRQISYDGSAWSSVSDITAKRSEFPSTLMDTSLNFTAPLFIYQNVTGAKVGFYGTWTVTTISVTQGSIGQKTDRTNLLTYAITTDGTMSTITEKVNGVTIGTRTTPASGQSFIAGLTQAQWDAVKYGKYKDITGSANTLTVTMGSEVFTFTFDKRLATDADVLSAAKATQDVQTTYLPSVKSKLASAITSKGGSATGADSWDTLETAVKNIPLSKKEAKGSMVADGSGWVTVSGLTFQPRLIRVIRTDNINFYAYLSGDISPTVALVNNNGTVVLTGTQVITANGFTVKSGMFAGNNVTWEAFE